MNFLIAGIFAFLFSYVLARLALLLFPKLGLMDRPEKYGHKRAPIPYYGGLVIIAGFVVSVLIFVPLDTRVIGLLAGALLIGMVSFLDDRYDLSPFLRLAVQAIAALILVIAGIGIHSVSNPFGQPLSLDLWQVAGISVMSAIFTVVWIVALMNTMNFLDGLNGLPSGVATIGAFTLFLLSMRPHFHAIDQTTFALLAIILAAVTFAFWLFDFYPAKILMGDTGSMFLGFLLATFAIFSGGKVATAFLVMGLPILDAVWVIGRRIWQGKSPFKGDLKHFHHRLLEAGFSNRGALCFIYALCALFGLTALFLDSVYKFAAIVTLIIVMIVIAVWVVNKAKK